jgi:hypothetical protein
MKRAALLLLLLASPCPITPVLATALCHLPVRHHPTIRTHSVHSVVFRGGFACRVEPQELPADCGRSNSTVCHPVLRGWEWRLPPGMR